MKGQPLFRHLSPCLVLVLALTGLAPQVRGIAQAHLARAAPARTVTAAAPVDVRGVLLALHRTTWIGEVAQGDGTLLGVHFASAAQTRGLRTGTRLVMSAVPQNHGHLLVRTLRVTGRADTARVRGIVARMLERHSFELLGLHGATVLVRLAPTSNLTAVQSRGTRTDVASASVAPGMQVDLDVGLDSSATLLARQIKMIKKAAGRVNLAGVIMATQPAQGTIIIANDNEQRSVISVGALARVYHVGQQVEVSGIAMGPGHSTASLEGAPSLPEDSAKKQTHSNNLASPTATAPTASPPAGQPGGTTSCDNACTATATPATTRGDDHRSGGGGTGCYYTCPATPTQTIGTPLPTANAVGEPDDHHGGGNTGCYYACPATPAPGGTTTVPTPLPAPTDEHHSGASAGCFSGCSPQATFTSSTPQVTPTASGEDHHSGAADAGCYYACPATPTVGAPVPTATTSAVTDDHGGHDGAGVGCSSSCPATATVVTTVPPSATATEPAELATATATAAGDDHKGGGCYYTCPPATGTSTAGAPAPTATVTPGIEAPTATPTVAVQPPVATPTSDDRQRGKPTATP